MRPRTSLSWRRFEKCDGLSSYVYASVCARTFREMAEILPPSCPNPGSAFSDRLTRLRVHVAGWRSLDRGQTSSIEHGGLQMSENRQQGQSQMGGQPGQSQTLQGWNQVKSKVQQQWSKLTDADLQQIGGQRNELIGRLQERYGYGHSQAEQEVDRFFRQMS